MVPIFDHSECSCSHIPMEHDDKGCNFPLFQPDRLCNCRAAWRVPPSGDSGVTLSR